MTSMNRDLQQPRAAIPSFDPPPLPAAITDYGRRILSIVGLYRAVCGMVQLLALRFRTSARKEGREPDRV